MNTLKSLGRYNQSYWIDGLHHEKPVGWLQTLIDRDYLVGVAANPVTGGWPTLRSIRTAAEMLKPVHERTHGRDGYVCLPIPPDLTCQPAAAVQEAGRLWREVNRPNLMITVPATDAGLKVIQHLVASGIPVNAAFVSTRRQYRKAVRAYLSGLEDYLAKGGDPQVVAAVVSVSLAEIDMDVDARLTALQMRARCQTECELADSLLGRAAIANAKLIYLSYLELQNDQCWGELNQRWRALEEAGARPLRLLWTDTRVKNSGYRKLKYVENLTSGETFTTIAPEMVEIVRNHRPNASTLSRDLSQARQVVENLSELDISLAVIAKGLRNEGLRSWQQTYERRHGVLAGPALKMVNG